MPAQLDRKLVLAHAGPRDFQEMPVVEIGDARRLARPSDLVVGLGRGRVENDVVGWRGSRQVGRNALRDAEGCDGQARYADDSLGMSRQDRTQFVGHVIAADDPGSRADFPCPLRIPGRDDDQGGLARAIDETCRRPERLEAAQHHHRVWRLDEMRAVMDGDDEIETTLFHARADGF